MIKKNLGVLASCALVMGLAACNNNDDQAFDYTNRNGVTNVSYNGDAYRPYGGTVSPFAEDLRSQPYGDRGNAYTNVGFNGNRGNGYFTQNRNVNEKNDMNLAISNMKTSLSSQQYPHTRAVLIQDAQYKYVQVSPEQAKQLQEKIRQQLQAQQQPSTQQAPAPQQQQVPKQPQAQAPTPQQAPAQQQEKATDQAEAPKSISQAAQQVIELTNVQRRKNGLPDLKADAQLSGVAQKKSTDMQQNNYFSHTSPTYGSPFDMMRDFGVTYRTAGENIAQGQQTPEQVVQSWMNSAGHRKNILSRDFTHIGVGYDQNGHHWTQMFIGK